jgi:hypothetical protein
MTDRGLECMPLMKDQAPEILNDRDTFFKVISNFVKNDCEDTGPDSISFILCQFDQIVKFFECVGLENIIHVFNAICNHARISFSYSNTWKVCSISGIPSRKTLHINDSIFVSTRYEKWVKCVWLSTHMFALELSRRHERYTVKTIKEVDADVYRRALKYVFDSFLQMYETLLSKRLRKAQRLQKK